MANKFKVGDKVKIIMSDIMNETYTEEIGKTATITDVWGVSTSHPYRLANIHGLWGDDELELVDFTKDDLQTGDVVTLRNGDKLIINDSMMFKDITSSNDNCLYSMDDLTNNLLYCSYFDGSSDEDNDIIKVERPTYTTVFEREENEVKEMTLKEICDVLGYEVKIIKEDK